MEFETKITGFATGLLILASYMIAFDLWHYTGFLIGVSAILLLLVAFRDYEFKRSFILNIIVALLLALFFLTVTGNPYYTPLIVVLILCVLAFNAKLETLVPSLVGVLSVIFITPSLLMKGMNALFLTLAPLFGIRSAIDQSGYLHLYYTRTHLPIFADETKILLAFYFALLLAHVVLLLITETDRKTILKSLPVVIVLPFFFSVLTLLHMIYQPSTEAFVPDNWHALVFPVACILLLSAWTPGTTIKRIESNGITSKKVTSVLLVAFFVLALVYATPLGTRPDPVVIIDESHSEWEPTWTDYIEAYDIDPVSGVNNYYGLLHVLSSLYDVTLLIDRPDKEPAARPVGTVLIDDEITLQTLEDIAGDRTAVLILKCVTRSYSEAEVDAIMQFLAEGNGLILIGEHTDLYDMGSNLNPFAEQMGYRYVRTGIQDVYSEERGTITYRNEFPALIARYLTGDFLWETGCHLEKVDGKDTLFEVRGRPSYFAHYENETAAFFLTRVFTEEFTNNCRFHPFTIVAGATYGDGKAIIWTDSTPFNNGLVGFGEHLQAVIGMIEYTAFKDSFNKAFLPFLLVAIALIALFVNRKTPLKVLIVIALLLLIAFTISYPLAYTIPFPELKTEPKATALLLEGDYYGIYFSGALDISEIADTYFRQNLTMIIFPERSEDWFKICSAVEELQG